MLTRSKKYPTLDSNYLLEAPLLTTSPKHEHSLFQFRLPTSHPPVPLDLKCESFSTHEFEEGEGNQNPRYSFINDANSRLLNSHYHILDASTEITDNAPIDSIRCKDRGGKKNNNNVSKQDDNVRSSPSSHFNTAIGKHWLICIFS